MSYDSWKTRSDRDEYQEHDYFDADNRIKEINIRLAELDDEVISNDELDEEEILQLQDEQARLWSELQDIKTSLGISEW